MTTVSHKFATLDGMRGVAALCVVAFHMHSSFWAQIAASGYLAVDVFFAMSGFVLAKAYSTRLATGALTTGRFLKLRLVRFYPLYIAGLALGVVQFGAQSYAGSPNAVALSAVPSALLAALLFLPAYIFQADEASPLNGPAWSLIFELWVNVAWSATDMIRRLPTMAIVAVAGVVFAAAAVAQGDANMGHDASTLIGGIARTLFSFFGGVLIAKLDTPTTPARQIQAVLVLCAVAFALLLDPSPSYRLGYDLLFVFVVSPALVTAGSRFEPGPRMGAVCKWLGAVSFPIYALHQPLIAGAILAVRVLHLSPLLGGVLSIGGMMAIADIANRIDLRVRSWVSPRKGINTTSEA